MKLSLSTKWFLWLSIAVAVFCVAQVLGMVWLELMELVRGEGSPKEEFSEIVVLLSVSGCVFIIMLGGFWFISKRMIRPLREMAESAHRISEGNLMERVEDSGAADEVGMLASTLNRAFDRYYEVVQRLDGFAGNAAHQMRTPLASIRSMGEVCLQRERNSGEYRQCIAEMLEATQELTGIVGKLLTIARLNPLRVRQQFTKVMLPEVLDQILAVYEVMFKEKNIALESGEIPPLSVMGDGDLIGQVIGNVVENAVQFAPEGGAISVALEEREGGVVLRVSDNGPGMSESMRLQYLGGHDRSWNDELPIGRMGLAIVFEIMRLHEGTVEIGKREGGGTCVELGWPC